MLQLIHMAQAVTERLASHVLANYDKFVNGINKVGTIESDLQAALAATKVSRQQLASAASQVDTNMLIGRQTRCKQALTHMLDLLLRLQQAHTLHEELKCVQCVCGGVATVCVRWRGNSVCVVAWQQCVWL